MSFSTDLSTLLTDQGIESRVVASSRRRARLVLDDPASFPKARKAMRVAGLTVRKATADRATLDVTAGESDEDEFQTLIGSWRAFVKNSSGNGFRKARRIGRDANNALFRTDTLEAARQITAKVADLGTKSVSMRRFAIRLQKAIRRARRTGDLDSVHRLMAVLAGQEQPAMKRKKNASRRRAGATSVLFDKAMEFLQNYTNDQGLDATAVRRLGAERGDAYQAWLQTLDESSDASDTGVVWKLATDASAHLLEDDVARTASGRFGSESGIDTVVTPAAPDPEPKIFASGPRISGMDLRPGKKETIRVVGNLISHYAAKKHPEDLDDRDIKRFLASRAPEFRLATVKKALKWVLKTGIPGRDA